MGLLNTWGEHNKVTNDALQLKFSTQQNFYGNKRYDRSYWVVTRTALKNYEYVGMDYVTAKDCWLKKQQQYTRVHSDYKADTWFDGSDDYGVPMLKIRPEWNVMNGSDVTLQKQDSHMWKVVIAVNEQDTMICTYNPTDYLGLNSLFSWANTRDYDEVDPTNQITLLDASLTSIQGKAALPYQTNIVNFNRNSLSVDRRSLSGGSWQNANDRVTSRGPYQVSLTGIYDNYCWRVRYNDTSSVLYSNVVSSDDMPFTDYKFYTDDTAVTVESTYKTLSGNYKPYQLFYGSACTNLPGSFLTIDDVRLQYWPEGDSSSKRTARLYGNPYINKFDTVDGTDHMSFTFVADDPEMMVASCDWKCQLEWHSRYFDISLPTRELALDRVGSVSLSTANMDGWVQNAEVNCGFYIPNFDGDNVVIQVKHDGDWNDLTGTYATSSFCGGYSDVLTSSCPLRVKYIDRLKTYTSEQVWAGTYPSGGWKRDYYVQHLSVQTGQLVSLPSQGAFARRCEVDLSCDTTPENQHLFATLLQAGSNFRVEGANGKSTVLSCVEMMYSGNVYNIKSQKFDVGHYVGSQVVTDYTLPMSVWVHNRYDTYLSGMVVVSNW